MVWHMLGNSTVNVADLVFESLVEESSTLSRTYLDITCVERAVVNHVKHEQEPKCAISFVSKQILYKRTICGEAVTVRCSSVWSSSASGSQRYGITVSQRDLRARPASSKMPCSRLEDLSVLAGDLTMAASFFAACVGVLVLCVRC